jgi:hypothetical protein
MRNRAAGILASINLQFPKTLGDRIASVQPDFIQLFPRDSREDLEGKHGSQSSMLHGHDRFTQSTVNTLHQLNQSVTIFQCRARLKSTYRFA